MRSVIGNLLLIACFSLYSPIVSAHEGHKHAVPPGEDAATPLATTLTLSETALHNLGVETAPATITEIAKTIRLSGVVDVLPDRTAQITSKVPSRITEVHAFSGDEVKAGQLLMKITPLAVGSTVIEVTAPIDGTVVLQSATRGQSTDPQDVLFEIADLSKIMVRGKAFETSNIPDIKIGQTVRVYSPAFPNKPLSGKVVRRDRSFNKNTRALDVYAELDNSGSLLLRNMQVELQVEVGERYSAVVVPRRAITGDDGNKTVFVKSGNVIERRAVKLGVIAGTTQEIMEGVLPDEDVVITGNYQLQFVPASAAQGSK